MRIKIVGILFLTFILTGCYLDPYTNEKYGKQVIYSWFSYIDGENDLGKIRRKVENIDTIEDVSCKYIEKYKTNYVFKCTLSYKELGETLIPFSNTKTLNVYALFRPTGDKFTYKVYNSTSKEKIWKSDDEL